MSRDSRVLAAAAPPRRFTPKPNPARDGRDIGVTTTHLARRLRISPASVSRHTTVLRDAGLVTTHRHGPAVLHTITWLGGRLLDQHSSLA